MTTMNLEFGKREMTMNLKFGKRELGSNLVGRSTACVTVKCHDSNKCCDIFRSLAIVYLGRRHNIGRSTASVTVKFHATSSARWRLFYLRVRVGRRHNIQRKIFL
jgi:hypothetical protein